VSEETQAHYDRLADSYDENWEYSPAFIAWMTGCIVDRLSVQRGDRVADIGCGTGLYARGLADLTDEVVCIDPSAKMLDQLPEDDAYIPVHGSAEDLVAGDVRLPCEEFDAILVKEAIHHAKDRRSVLNGLAGLLTQGGRLLVVMLPTRIHYPLFDRALAIFDKHQPDPRDVASALENSGVQVGLAYESFPLSFSKDRYLRMVRNRYMSLLSVFADDELEAGIREIEQRHPEDPLRFPDRFVDDHVIPQVEPGSFR
jgi:ubiquinone/menaquinone biosynthesis C-methylase UbiE